MRTAWPGRRGGRWTQVRQEAAEVGGPAVVRALCTRIIMSTHSLIASSTFGTRPYFCVYKKRENTLNIFARSRSRWMRELFSGKVRRGVEIPSETARGFRPELKLKIICINWVGPASTYRIPSLLVIRSEHLLQLR